jgi:uncharacterized protein
MESHVRQIVTFLALLIFLSAISNALLQVTHSVGGGLYMPLFMWTPGLAALITCVVYRRDVSSLGWGWHSVRHKAYGYLLPLIYIVPVYVVTWIAIRSSFDSGSFVAESAGTVHFPQSPRLATFGVYLPLALTFGILTRFANTLGEELGWRGYLLPLLTERFGFRPAAFMTGGIWALWHYPLLLLPGFITKPKSAMEMTFFTGMVIGLSFVIGWLRMKTQSIWPCVLLHAAHNGFLQTVFDPLTAPVGKAHFITTEFGPGLMLTVILVGLALALRKKPAAEEQRA